MSCHDSDISDLVLNESAINRVLDAQPFASKNDARRVWQLFKDDVHVTDVIRGIVLTITGEAKSDYDKLLSSAMLALRSIRYNAEFGSQDRPQHERLRLIAVKANEVLAEYERAFIAKATGAAP